MMTPAAHEKKISKVAPWLWLGTGSAIVGLTGVWTVSAAVYGVLDPMGLCTAVLVIVIGTTLIHIGVPERRRAEDWANWQTPATQIAETHEGQGKMITQQEAIRVEMVRHNELEAQRLEVLYEIRRYISDAVAELKSLSRLGAGEAKTNGHHHHEPESVAREEEQSAAGGEPAGVIAMPNARIYQLGIEEGLRRAKGRPGRDSPN